MNIGRLANFGTWTIMLKDLGTFSKTASKFVQKDV